MNRLLRNTFARPALATAAAAALVVFASARNKDKVLLPEYVLRAETVAVVILPDTAEPLNDPFANRKALEDVEKALMTWGRFRLAQETGTADLVIAIRKGTGKVANPTISGGPIDSRPATVETTDNHIRIGLQQGRPPDQTQTPPDANGRTNTGMEAGTMKDDMFEVFRAGDAASLRDAPVWSYNAKDALKPPAVAAVEKFRKAIDEAEKAAAQKQQQSQKHGQKKNP